MLVSSLLTPLGGVDRCYIKACLQEIPIKTSLQGRTSPERSCSTVSRKLSEKEGDHSFGQLRSEQAIPPLELSPSLGLSSLSLIL